MWFSNVSILKVNDSELPQKMNSKIAGPVSNSFGLMNAFENFRFRDGLVWTVGQTVKK